MQFDFTVLHTLLQLVCLKGKSNKEQAFEVNVKKVSSSVVKAL